MQARASIEKVDVLDGRIALELELVRADLSKGITVKSEVRLSRARRSRIERKKCILKRGRGAPNINK